MAVVGLDHYALLSSDPERSTRVYEQIGGLKVGPRPKLSVPTPEEKIALYDTLFAYVGTYVVESDRVIHTLDGTWNELWTGTKQTRLLAFEGDRLVYRTPETVDPMDGKLCTYRVEFERA